MPYLAHLDTERLKTAEQAAAVLDNLASYWDKDQKATISVLLARLRQCSATRWLGMSAPCWVGMTGDGKGPADGVGGAWWCPGCRGGGR
ncbi:MAG: hypothetical protein ACRDPY_39035, partial [Streptosporangiaceae bacterium]